MVTDFDMTALFSIYGTIGTTADDDTEYLSTVVMDDVSGTMYSPRHFTPISDGGTSVR